MCAAGRKRGRTDAEALPAACAPSDDASERWSDRASDTANGVSEPAEDAKGSAAHYALDGPLLGAGAFGKVSLVKHRRSGVQFACKLMPKLEVSLEDAVHEEVIMTTAGTHEHIIGFFDAFELPDAWALVTELATGGEVFDRICERGMFSEADAASVVRQVALALAHLHELKICHRDLKPENLLLSSSGADARVKLADFGLAAFHDPPHVRMVEEVGTASYTAPEVFAPPTVSLARGGGVAPGYDKSVDLWSLGCLTYTLLCGHTPFDPDGHDDNLTIRYVADGPA